MVKASKRGYLVKMGTQGEEGKGTSTFRMKGRDRTLLYLKIQSAKRNQNIEIAHDFCSQKLNFTELKMKNIIIDGSNEEIGSFDWLSLLNSNQMLDPRLY